jgi:hypothetical protein
MWAESLSAGVISLLAVRTIHSLLLLAEVSYIICVLHYAVHQSGELTTLLKSNNVITKTEPEPEPASAS